jgi:predicted transcriptional regulator
MPPNDARMSDKQLALEAISRMPESITLREVSEEIAILASIRDGEAAADAGRVVSHEEVVRKLLQ